MGNNRLIVLFFLAVSWKVQAQSDLYRISFSDKSCSEQRNYRAEDLFSPRALERRSRVGMTSISFQDLPVCQDYLQQLSQVQGLSIRYPSRWFNSVTIELSDTNLIAEIRAYPFVKSIEFIGSRTKGLQKELFLPNGKNSLLFSMDEWYGQARNQIAQLNGHLLHQAGFSGEGMIIAVMDSGFPETDVLEGFRKMIDEGRLLGTYDFVQNEENVYNNTSRHGTAVLSCMASKAPGELVGTAPEASYYLFITEDAVAEYIGEEDNWVAAAELADSLGVDIINTSLGYTRFDDSTQDHSYADMDGNTTRITIATDLAAQRGILCVSSAGNSGTNNWFYISAPADADSSLTVGAVDGYGQYVAFSSKGPTSDGRIKPNVAAQGVMSRVYWTAGEIIPANGTSFSSPIMAGIAASLWQAFPQKNNMEILRALELSGNQAQQPDSLMGYGIPDLRMAFESLGGSLSSGEKGVLSVHPNPFQYELFIDIHIIASEALVGEFFDLSGRSMGTYTLNPVADTKYRLSITDTDFLLQRGVYFLRIKGAGLDEVIRVIKY